MRKLRVIKALKATQGTPEGKKGKWVGAKRSGQWWQSANNDIQPKEKRKVLKPLEMCNRINNNPAAIYIFLNI